MGGTEYMVAAEALHVGEFTRVDRLHPGFSDFRGNLGPSTAWVDSRGPARNASRRKSRSKAKVAKKSGEKVFPEELLSDTFKEDESTTSCKSLEDSPGDEAVLGSLSTRDSSPNLENFSNTKICSSEQLLECATCGNSKQCDLQLDGCCELDLRMKAESECSEPCVGVEAQAVSQCTSFDNVNTTQSSRATFSKDGANQTKPHPTSARKKGQSRLTWQRSQRGRSNHNDKAVQILLNGDALSYDSVRNKAAAMGTKTPDSEDDVMFKGDYKNGSSHSVYWDRVAPNLTDSGKIRTRNWRSTRGQGAKSDRYSYRYLSPQSVLLQQPYPLGSKFSSKDQGDCNVTQPCVWMRWSRVKPIEDHNLCHSLNDEKQNASSLESCSQYRIKRGQDNTQQPSSRKWIPVCKRKLKIPKTNISLEIFDHGNENQSTELGFHIEDTVASLRTPSTSSSHGNTNLVSAKETILAVEPPLIKSEDVPVAPKSRFTRKCYHPLYPGGFRDQFISAQMVEQAFISSYRLQLASESVHKVSGFPIAEFERVVDSTTPFIASSLPCAASGCHARNQPCRPFLCRDEMPQISLNSIWDWYDEPGNYGLKVDVNDPHSSNGSFADRVSYHAHFVPLLSAVQLFGYHHLSSSCGNSQHGNLELHNKEDKIQPSHIGNHIMNSSLKPLPVDALADTVNSDHTVTVDAPALFDDADLVFEFFESEQPQRRMPLRNKIMELISKRTSSGQIFGDPSKLERMNLNDVHPASWYSVAWYPIYRIPEGNLRAAFLTYHSLGHLIQRSVTNRSLDKSTLGVTLPTIGLQSYNSQGELWFRPNTEVESSFKELSSVLLKERLTTLEKNALVFARAVVSKDQATTTNRQPDYEFFVSRKY